MIQEHQSLGDPWSFFISPLLPTKDWRCWSEEWNSTLDTSFSINTSKRTWIEQVAELITSQHLNYEKCNHSSSEVGLSCIEFLDDNCEILRLTLHLPVIKFWIVLSSGCTLTRSPIVDCTFKQTFLQQYICENRMSSNHSLLSLLNDYKEFASETNKALLEISQIGNSVEFSFVNGDLSTFETDEDEPSCLIVRLRLHTIFERSTTGIWSCTLMMSSKRPPQEIVFRGKTNPDKAKEKLHSIPCKVEFTGASPVSQYFEEENLLNGNIAATFRGRLLYGQEVALPEKYCIFATKESEAHPGSSKSLQIESTFKKFNSWDYDCETSASSKNSVFRALNILKIADDLAEED
uniref:Uncharacterized protein n=1 Tax=Ditylenchus dipsaci TaxID=166011 RepID=A0A915DTN3_9BILA